MANWTDNARVILEARYLKKDKKGVLLETPDDMLLRVADSIACAEKSGIEAKRWSLKFLDIMDTLEFLPNSPTLMNAGRDLGQLSACLTGDTVVRACEGDISIRELAERYKDKPEQRFGVYSIVGKNQVGVGEAFNPRLTRKDAPVFEVIFDDGSSVKATEEHLFMLRDGSFCALKDLVVGQSVMPFNRDYKHGYPILFEGVERYPISAHKLVYRAAGGNLKANQVLHHKDFNKSNNSIENLEKMDKREHFLWHSKNFSGDNNPMRRFPSLRKEAGERIKGDNNPMRRFPDLARAVGERMKVVNKGVYRGKIVPEVKVGCLICGAEFMKKETSSRQYCGSTCASRANSAKGRKSWAGNNNPSCHGKGAMSPRVVIKEWACEECGKSFMGRVDRNRRFCSVHCAALFNARLASKIRRAKAGHNHKIVSVEFAGYEDVYDLSVEKYHNFAANNVFVHNCFLIPLEDDLSNIFESLKQVALIHKTGGGTGILFSKIRPKDSRVQSTSGVASGPVSFMRAFDVATDVIKQGGVRRGANMGILSINHPDIYEFIACKEDTRYFQNFNISVSVTDNFFKAVEAGNGYPLRNPFDKTKTYTNAKELFDTICYQAWLTGEPGLIFIDTINRYNPTPWLGRMEGCNPCSEQPLLGMESCNLGSIDVSRFEKDGSIQWNKLAKVVEVAVRFLDDVIDVNKYPNVKIARKTRLTRKIGLGVMGWADLLIKMGMRYDSEEAIALAEKLMGFIQERGMETSKAIGLEKGHCFPQLGRRNSTVTTIAPTGTLSILADCSSGIEPLFGKEFTKKVLGNTSLRFGEKYRNFDESLLVTATNIPVSKHLEMQAAFQKHICNAVSKTINLTRTATVDDVREAFLLAHKLGCKGISVYRDGSRDAPIQEEGHLSECDGDKCTI